MVMISNDFKKQLEYGKEVEVITQQLFMRMGWFVIPKYLYVEKGAPSLIGMEFKYSVPDLDVSCNGRRFWVETKRKQLRNFYPDTGFSKRLFEHYTHVQKITGSPVYVIFFDEKLNSCYGNWLNNLTRPHEIMVRGNKKIKYPLEQPTRDYKREMIIYFPHPEAFKILGKLDTLNLDLDGYENLKKTFHTKIDNMSGRFATKQTKIFEF